MSTKNNPVTLPSQVRGILERLAQQGFEACAVGGCVRDSLLGRTPGDWDIATSALPEQVAACFAEHTVIPTGIAHGTVTVLVGGEPYEITTYRVDGEYTDHRRPEGVTFSRSLREDLARRDFTINAMAFSPELGLVDYFGGRQDLHTGRIACVGDPERRFSEDALRILRAARFASVLDFTFDGETLSQIRKLRHLLEHVSGERIASELRKAVLGTGFARVFAADCAAPALLQVLPELSSCAEDHLLWNQTLGSLSDSPPVLPIRLALLFFHTGDTGRARADAACTALRRLHFDNATTDRVCLLARCAHMRIRPESPALRRWLGRLGPEALEQLLVLQLARSETAARASVHAALEGMHRILSDGLCWSLDTLAVTGRDLLSIGCLPGPELGKLLRRLLSLVLSDRLPNERSALLSRAKILLRHTDQP